VLVVGAGRFGRRHLAEWQRLVETGEATIAGIVVTRPESQRSAQALHAVLVHQGLDERLLRQVDAVDIVTPSSTHAALVRQCLPHAHVLVEKPLAVDPGEARALVTLARSLGRVLMVGHVYRFHPVIGALRHLTASLPDRPREIRGILTNPLEERGTYEQPNLEMLHLFDIIDLLFSVEPEAAAGRRAGWANEISLRYPGSIQATLRIGWEGEERLRTLELRYEDRRIVVDLVDNTLTERRTDGRVDTQLFPERSNALLNELRAFVAATRGADAPYPDASVGERIVRIAARSAPPATGRAPRVAVIGGGIFGVTCASEIGKEADVSLFERHGALMREASLVNQRRHHQGFHYPRSYPTVAEIRNAQESFLSEYGAAVVGDMPAYACVAASAREISAARYLAACRAGGLEFAVAPPPEGVVDSSRVSLCLRIPESVYDLSRLTQIAHDRLHASAGVRLHLGTTVESATIGPDGAKRLAVSGPRGCREEGPFDYVINATYANRNVVAERLGFGTEPLRFDLYEMLLLRLPIAQMCVTVFDGPFTTLIGTGEADWFLLSHIRDSVSRTAVPADGAPPRWTETSSNRANMLRHSARYLPILREAHEVQSLWATRALHASARDDDARPTTIRYHGFGCWSLLGGKIVTCVANARLIAAEIQGAKGASQVSG
jgi:predicted dehydrogenase